MPLGFPGNMFIKKVFKTKNVECECYPWCQQKVGIIFRSIDYSIPKVCALRGTGDGLHTCILYSPVWLRNRSTVATQKAVLGCVLVHCKKALVLWSPGTRRYIVITSRAISLWLYDQVQGHSKPPVDHILCSSSFVRQARTQQLVLVQ